MSRRKGGRVRETAAPLLAALLVVEMKQGRGAEGCNLLLVLVWRGRKMGDCSRGEEGGAPWVPAAHPPGGEETWEYFCLLLFLHSLKWVLFFIFRPWGD
ncbi:hypothetical protein BS78_09G202500 [Paspalum vaginatum]|nr:hypothetical protein BS78_09G202500 [Paspalum vaginatum]